MTVANLEEAVPRALLFAPANHPRKAERVGTFGADAVVLDLEDAVAESEKLSARRSVVEALGRCRDTVRCVRVNGERSGLLEGDVGAVACDSLDALVVPKVEGPEVLLRVSAQLADLERRHGWPGGRIRLLALVETAAGVARCEEIARGAPGRLLTLVFGLGDFSADLEIELTREGTELLYARSRILVAARAAGLAAPIDGPYLDLHDLDGLVADTRRSRGLGFRGRVVVYPPHVAPVQRAYSHVTPEELERAARIVASFEAAERAGTAAIQVDGRLVDYPVYRSALARLESGRARAGRDAGGPA